MTRARAVLLILLIAAGIAGCGRKDFPDYPPDAVERPGTLQRRGEPIRYY